MITPDLVDRRPHPSVNQIRAGLPKETAEDTGAGPGETDQPAPPASRPEPEQSASPHPSLEVPEAVVPDLQTATVPAYTALVWELR